MLVLKIIFQFLGILVGVAVGLLDYIWHDKRTTRFKKARSYLLFGLFPILLGVSILIVILDDRDHRTEVAQLHARFDESNQKAKDAEAMAAKRDAVSVSQFAEVHQENQRLELMLRPFVSLARQRHPETSSSDALSKFAVELSQQRRELTTQRQEVSSLKDLAEASKEYSSIAALNGIGITGIAGAGLVETTPISKLLDGTYTRDGDRYTYLCTDETVAKFRNAVFQAPKFPFSYYALTFCFQRQNNPEWITYASQAVKILRKTTLIAGHNPSQDAILAELEKTLAAARKN